MQDRPARLAVCMSCYRAPPWAGEVGPQCPPIQDLVKSEPAHLLCKEGAPGVVAGQQQRGGQRDVGQVLVLRQHERLRANIVDFDWQWRSAQGLYRGLGRARHEPPPAPETLQRGGRSRLTCQPVRMAMDR